MYTDRRIGFADALNCAPDRFADRDSGPLAGIGELPRVSGEAGGTGQLGGQPVPFDARPGGPLRLPGPVQFREVSVEPGQSIAVVEDGRAVEVRLLGQRAAGREGEQWRGGADVPGHRHTTHGDRQECDREADERDRYTDPTPVAA